MVMEFAEQGSLKHVLNNAAEKVMVVSNRVLMTIGIQVADAMMHLKLYEIIHRDLAVRNVLVLQFDLQDWKKVLVKVTDYGLALLTNKGHTGKSIIEVSTYSTSLAGPTRWMAVESLQRCMYSSQSDVWSFGVMQCEIMTLGFEFYNTITDDRAVADAVIAGERLPKPENCPDSVYAIMLMCWQERPGARSVMEVIRTQLQDALAKMGPECSICLDAEAVIALMPCGHRCVCEAPACMLQQLCPIDSVYAIMLMCWQERPGARYVMEVIRTQLQDALAKMGPECSICLDAEALIALMPCRHRCVCEAPACMLQQLCPICRKPVVEAKRIYD